MVRNTIRMVGGRLHAQHGDDPIHSAQVLGPLEGLSFYLLGEEKPTCLRASARGLHRGRVSRVIRECECPLCPAGVRLVLIRGGAHNI